MEKWKESWSGNQEALAVLQFEENLQMRLSIASEGTCFVFK